MPTPINFGILRNLWKNGRFEKHMVTDETISVMEYMKVCTERGHVERPFMQASKNFN